MENIGDSKMPGWISYDDPTKVINQCETKEFEEYCNIMHDWYNKGFVRKDGATLTNTDAYRKAGKIAAATQYGWLDTIDMPELEAIKGKYHFCVSLNSKNRFCFRQVPIAIIGNFNFLYFESLKLSPSRGFGNLSIKSLEIFYLQRGKKGKKTKSPKLS